MSINLTGLDGEARYRGAQYKFRAFCWNGRNRMRKWDGMNWQNAGIAKAAFTPGVAAAAGVGPDGTYRYYVSPVNSKQFNLQGKVIAGLPSTISAEITVVNTSITVSGIPATHVDSQVDRWYIYRNRSGYYDTTLEDEIQEFYYVGSVALGTTSYEDTATDDSLVGLDTVRFNQNIPPTFKYGEIYGERLFGCGFDPISTGTATVGSPATAMNFSSAIQDGAIGCWFKKDGDDQQYRIVAQVSSTQLTLDRAFVGACSGATYSIYRYPWLVYMSDFGDPEACGLDGEAFRWVREVPGLDEARGLCHYADALLVFTLNSIYAISGKGLNAEDVRITPSPLYSGLGSVGGDAIWRHGDELYFLSLLGPAVMRGGAPELIGWPLGRDWMLALTDVELKKSVVYGQDDFVWFGVPRSGETTCSRVWRYRRSTNSWWEETGFHPLFGFRDNGDDGRKAKTFCAQARYLYAPDSGTTDMTPTSGTAYAGTLTAQTTTSATDNTASLPTSGGGLQQCYVHFYRTTAGIESYVGSRRITSNTATQVSWSSSTGTGNGALTLANGDRYEIGRIAWTWTTRTWDIAGHVKRDLSMQLIFSQINANWTLNKQDYIDGVASSAKQTGIQANELGKVWDLNLRNRDYYTVLDSRTGAVLRHVVLRSAVKESFK